MDPSSSSSHMPKSIFPDIPASRRAAPPPPIAPAFTDTVLPGPPPPTLNVNTRRHTTQFLPPHREARPLRSSPLAGPSLALSQDGTLDESEAGKPSSPSEAYTTGATSESPTNDLSSPLSECSSSGHALSAPEPHTSTEHPQDGSISSRIRRLSLGFKRRPSTGPPAQPDSPPRARRASSSSSHSHGMHDAPPVPELPEWARGSEKRASPPSSLGKHSKSQNPSRRPSTSPTSTSESASTSARRQSILSQSQLPSTSRNPEENWMTSASAPRFSRLSLKADGVVMPVSLKEARRRSTASLSSRSVKGKQSTRSLRSIHPSSETAKRLAEDAEMQPPRPLFSREDANGSNSSLGSSVTDTDSIMTEARSISRISSMTDGELPLPPHAHTDAGKSSSTLELRINDVTIDMISYEHTHHGQHPPHPPPHPPHPTLPDSPRSFTEMELATINEVETQEAKAAEPPIVKTDVETKVSQAQTPPPRLKRTATLKKVWKRVIRSVTG